MHWQDIFSDGVTRPAWQALRDRDPDTPDWPAHWPTWEMDPDTFKENWRAWQADPRGYRPPPDPEAPSD